MSLIQELTESVRGVFRLHRHLLDSKVRKTGVFRGQHHILMYLSSHPMSAQNEIAKSLEISPAAVATSLKRLEKDGYVEKALNSRDNRFYQVKLTEKGLDVVKQSFMIFQKVDSGLFDGFSEEEKEQMLLLFHKMYHNLQKMAEEEEI